MFHVPNLPAAQDGQVLHGPHASMFDRERAIMARLRVTIDLIERMLAAERERYFDALALKRCGRLNGNVTARFFAEPASSRGDDVRHGLGPR